MDINKWKRAQFYDLPTRNWQQELMVREFVLLPTRQKHDSGYLLMDAALFGEGFDPFRSGLSDHFMFSNRTLWEMDLLPVSKLFRMWVRAPVRLGPALSTTEFGRTDAFRTHA